ncbi:hypothetical protein FALBO_11668, partial [Fusarium albosuccineum]
MKFLSLLMVFVAPLTAHAWTGDVFNNMDDCKKGCEAKCIEQGGAWDGCSGNGDGPRGEFTPI